MKRTWTLEEWQRTRIRRRRICELISTAECGKLTSPDDAKLRAAYDGRRNRPFDSTESLAELARQLGASED
jgi:hypothetical protein